MSVPHQPAEGIALVMPMIASGLWSALTGDTFLPALMGGCFAAYFQAQGGGRKLGLIDAGVIIAISFVVGVIAGPWVAAQLPDGEGVVGVGTLIAAFLGTTFLQKLHQLDWDVGALFKAIASAFDKRPPPKS